MRRFACLALAALPLATGGCLVKTAVDVATLPVRATGKAIDWTTTSPSERDRNYGRKVRKQEEKMGKELREADKECRAHPDDRDACARADEIRARLRAMPSS